MGYKKVFVNERYSDNGEFSHYELIDEKGEVLCSEEDKEQINLLTVERNSALQSQKDSFEEQQHIIDLQKGSIETTEANFKLFTEQYESKIEEQDKQIKKLQGDIKEMIKKYNSQDPKILRLQGKVKEAMDKIHFDLGFMNEDQLTGDGCLYVNEMMEYIEEWSNENLIK